MLYRRRLGIDAHEDGGLLQGITGALCRGDLFGNRAAHLVGRGVGIDLGYPVKALRELQLFGAALLVVADHTVGQHDLAGGTAEVFGHKVDLCPVAPLKVEDKAGVRPAPLVNRLVIIPDRHVIAMGLDQQVKNLGLGQVDILKFIH